MAAIAISEAVIVGSSRGYPKLVRFRISYEACLAAILSTPCLAVSLSSKNSPKTSDPFVHVPGEIQAGWPESQGDPALFSREILKYSLEFTNSGRCEFARFYNVFTQNQGSELIGFIVLTAGSYEGFRCLFTVGRSLFRELVFDMNAGEGRQLTIYHLRSHSLRMLP